MKTFKRALSGFLAMLMIFSAFSALTATAALNDGNNNSVEIYTDFWVKDEGGNWVKSDKVKAGKEVKVTVSIVTDFYVGTPTLFWVYSKNFMDFDPSNLTPQNPENETANEFALNGAFNPDGIPTVNNWGTGFICQSDELIEFSIADDMVYEGYFDGVELDEDGNEKDGYQYFDDKGWIALSSSSGTPSKYTSDTYMFEFYFKVKQNPTVDEGFFYVPPQAMMNTTNQSYGYAAIQRSKSESDFTINVNEQAYMMEYDVQLKDANTIKLYSETSTTYTQNVYTMDTTGAYGAAVTTTPTADIGATINAAGYTVPAGFTLDATKSTAGDVTIEDEGVSSIDIYLSRNKYTVSFDGVETQQYFDAAIAPATADEKEGYTFDGWYSGATKLTADTKVPVGGAAYTAKYNANDVGYTVNKYFMNTDGSTYAEPVVQALPGKTDANVSYADEDFEGFTLDTTKGTLSGTVTGDGKLVLEAYYTRDKISVTIDGEEKEMYYGETIDKPADPEADPGYKFDNWVDGEGDPITKWPVVVGEDPVVIEPAFSKLPRTVTYKYVGAPTGYEAPASKIAYIDDAIDLPTLPTVDGYAISGWVITDANGNEITDGKVGTTDVTVTATWTLNAYTVALELDGGEADTASIAKKHGDVLHADELPDVTKAGYDHVGWLVDGATATFPMTITDNVTLTAKLVLHDYTITYEFSGNKPATVDVPAATTGTMGSDIVLPSFGAVEGYTFGGWTIADVDGNEITDGKVGTADVIATGKWTINRHTVSFNTGVDTTIDAITRPYSQSITAPSTDISALKPGYSFDGWKDAATGAIVSFPFAMPDRDVELTAVWTAIPRNITYVYVGAPEGYTAPAATTGVIGDDIVLPALPTVDGYTISDWVVTGGDNGKVGTTDVTVTATWEKETYTVIFWRDEDGTEVYEEQTYTYGEALEYPDVNPTIPGYTFDAWSEAEGIEVTESFDVYPIYTAIEYNVTVNGLYGDLVDEWVAYYGDEITLGDLFTKAEMDAMLAENGDYYTFDAWMFDGEAMDADTVITVTEDVAIEGAFTAMDAKLIFKANGAKFANGSDTYEVALKYDDTITAAMYPAIPEFEGHTFKAWSLDLVGQTMDALEKTISITWTKKTASVKFVNGLTNEEIATVTGLYGDPVEAPDLPVVEGYNFAWDKTVATIPAENVTVTALPTLKEYTVNYYVDGKLDSTATVAYGKPISSEVAPTEGSVPSGYSFIGWSLDENATLPGNLGVVGAGDVNVYAVLQANGNVAYTVEIYKQTLGGGYELADTKEFTNGTTGKVAPYVVDTDVEGFVFNADASILDELVEGDGSTVLEVYYDRKTIIVDINGNEEEVIYGETIDLPNDVDDGDEGTTFDKWVDEDGNAVSDPYTVPDSDKPIILTPVFKNNFYDVIYYVDGEEVYREEVEYKATIKVIDGSAYVPAGYNFVSWTPAVTTMPAADVELEAVYEAATTVEYTVEFYKQTLDGGYELAGTETYQDGTTGEEAPYVVDTDKYEGFVFNADASILDDVVAGDGSTILEVYYDRKTIIVVINGEEKEVVFGETIDLPNDVDDNNPGTTFDKWVDEDGNAVSDPYTVPDSDEPIVIKPTYKNNSFEVKFVDELAGTVKSSTLVYSDKIPNPGSPSVAGYEFTGWYTADGDKYVAGTTTVPAADITFYAKYDALDSDYTVNVYLESLEGTWELESSEVLSAPTGETVTYTGSFDGFTLKADSVTEAVVKADGTTTLNVYFTRNDITIIVDGEEVKVPYGTEIDEDDLNADVDPGYKLDKWVDAEGNEIEFPVTIKGGEEFIPVLVKESYALKFQLADGTVLGETVAEFDADITAPQAPEAAEGFTFAGWVDQATNEPFNGKMPAKATVYVAVYTNNENAKFTVNIHVMNTKGVEECIASYSGTAAIGTTQTVVPGSYEYCTLDTARSNTSCVVLADGTAAINVYFVRGLYTVSFDGVEEEVYAGAVIPVPADPTDIGRTFTGWTPAVPEVMPENDLAFTSTWAEETYTITYIVNGDKIVHSYAYGDIVTAYKVTEAPAGLTFKGWSDAIPETMPAEDITVSAIFESAAYTVTYLDADGNVFVSYSVAFGAEIPVPTDAPVKEFYKFIGWASAPATMPAENLRIAPIFEPIAVKLIAATGSTTVIDRENMVIYGLEEGLTAKILDDNFLDYEGDGTLVIKPVTEGTSRYGTGAVVELYDNADGSLVETFHIVVFGDLNGDSYVNGLDISIASDEAAWITDWSFEDGDNFEVYKLIAADLDHNGKVKTEDVSSIKNYVLSLVEIDQVEGKIVRS